MKKGKQIGVIFGIAIFVAAFVWGMTAVSGQEPGRSPLTSTAIVGTGFTYQGELKENGTLVNGSCDFKVSLWDSSGRGGPNEPPSNQIGNTQLINDVVVVDGRFTVMLNGSGEFGPVPFNGDVRWLEIGVRCPSGSGSYMDLDRQNLTPVPYAMSLRPGATIGGDVASSGALNISNTNTTAGHGIMVSSGSTGVYVTNAEDDGLAIVSAGGNGVEAFVVGGPSSTTSPLASGNGFVVQGAERDGLYVGHADRIGVGVNEADGVGVWANSSAINGEWCIYTPDKISGANVTLNSLTLIAQVSGDSPVTAGDVIAAAGMAESLPHTNVRIPLVSLANEANAFGAAGVVEGRMILESQEMAEGNDGTTWRSVDGPAKPGDYVALTIVGVAEVKIDRQIEIQPGQRLTSAAEAGKVRPVRTEFVNGMRVNEGAPVIGIALEASRPDNDTVPVLVMLR